MKVFQRYPMENSMHETHPIVSTSSRSATPVYSIQHIKRKTENRNNLSHFCCCFLKCFQCCSSKVFKMDTARLPNNMPIYYSADDTPQYRNRGYTAPTRYAATKGLPVTKRSVATDHFRSWESEYDESPYDLSRDDDNLQRNTELQYTLQFLGAMEASKEEVDYDKMKDILVRFNQTLLVRKWFAWATFLRECKEHPVVCQLIQMILNDEEIYASNSDQGICETLESIHYLLKKTRFIPGKTTLWFTKEGPVPEVLGSALDTLADVSPTTITELKCGLHNCLALQLSLAQLERLDLIDLYLMGQIEKAKSEDFVDLIKYLGQKDAEFKLQVIIENTEHLTNFAQCCMIVPLPKRTELQLYVRCVSEEMLNPLCQILSTFSWMKSFSFAFTHTELGDKITQVQELLINALRQDSVRLVNVEMVVEAYAESKLHYYEEMAFAVAEDVPYAVVFEDGADGDDVTLVFKGVRQC